jgi:RimJ/RimL family protein N-acetyltransferase
MDTSNITIETNNLLLRGITLGYVPEIFKEFTAEITTYMFPKPPEQIEETLAFVEKSIQENKEGSNLQIVITRKDTGEFLGCGGLHHINTATPELGIWIKKSAWGHGYGKETMIALKEWADQNLAYEYILYPVSKENHASRRIPESMGATVAREYDYTNMSGAVMHSLEYRIYPGEKKIKL